jgi:hypothetical protein
MLQKGLFFRILCQIYEQEDFQFPQFDLVYFVYFFEKCNMILYFYIFAL